jgi:multisubunit Na+/H+ antiporter MnhE subunit
MPRKYKISLIILVVLFLLGLSGAAIFDPNQIRCGGGLGCMDQQDFNKYYGDSLPVRIYHAISLIVPLVTFLLVANIVVIIVVKIKQKNQNKN